MDNPRHISTMDLQYALAERTFANSNRDIPQLGQSSLCDSLKGVRDEAGLNAPKADKPELTRMTLAA